MSALTLRLLMSYIYDISHLRVNEVSKVLHLDLKFVWC